MSLPNNSGGGGAGTLTSFQGRTTPAAVLTAADVEGLFTAAGQIFAGTGSGTGELLAAGGVGTYLEGQGAAAPAWNNILWSQIQNTPTPLTPTPVKTANYNAVVADFVPCDISGGSFTVTLPTAPADGSVIEAKIINWAAGNTLTVAAGGSDVFNIAGGVTTTVLLFNNQGVMFQYKASTAIWYAVASDIGQGLYAMVENLQTASYTLVLADAGKAVAMNVATANTLTVPPNSSVAFPIGTVLEVFQLGAGLTTVTAGAGVTIDSPGGVLALGGQYATASLRKRGTNEWVLAGDL